MDRVLIVVPTYDERENVERAASSFREPLRGSEILFVDDASPDGTGQLLDRLAAGDSRVHVLHRSGRRGLGRAYVDGFRWALARGYDFVVEMDADFSHDPRHLPEMLRLARSGSDVVVGSRYVAGGSTRNWGRVRRAISRFGSLYSRAVLGVDIRDMTAGFVCHRRETLERLDLDAVQSNGYSFQIETKYRAIQAGLRVVETPIVFVDRRVGQSKMSRGIVAEAMWLCVKLRLESISRA
jgi:dolichol-phosphate mannosyltransferase